MENTKETMDIQFDYDIIKGENVIYEKGKTYSFPVAGGSASHWLKRGGREVVDGKTLEGTVEINKQEEIKEPKIPVHEPEDNQGENGNTGEENKESTKTEDEEFPTDDESNLANELPQTENKEETKKESKTRSSKKNS